MAYVRTGNWETVKFMILFVQMKFIHNVEVHSGTKEEKLPDFFQDFPYIGSYVELDKFVPPFVPWHWHKAIEFLKHPSLPGSVAASFLSERDCYRAFHDCLHMTPSEYIKSYRLQMACQMLANGQESITSIGHMCELGSSSYFGKVFREHMDCTPTAYRSQWQNIDT